MLNNVFKWLNGPKADAGHHVFPEKFVDSGGMV